MILTTVMLNLVERFSGQKSRKSKQVKRSGGKSKYYISNQQNSKSMSKPHNSSYEGFRRKTSLNSQEITKSTTPLDLSSLKFKTEDMKLVENLSMELDNISKRSLTPRSAAQRPIFHSHSSRTIGLHSELLENNSFNSSFAQDTSSLRKIETVHEEEKNQQPETKKQKISNLTVFNKFQIIEESRSFCEQEIIDDIEPVTLKGSLHQKINSKKQILHKQPPPKSAATNQIRKQPIPLKVDPPSQKRDRAKLDISELDKMQKQLDSKRMGKESTALKGLSNSTNFRKHSNTTGGLKESTKLKPAPPSHQYKPDAFKTTKIPMKKTAPILLPPKMTESKASFDEQLFQEQMKAQTEPMVATRMLSDKQKLSLIGRVLGLREIIQKNEVCSDSLDVINSHLSSIEKLLTR